MNLYEIINAIPDNVGWMFVGMAVMACVVTAGLLGKTLVTMWHEYHNDNEEE